MKDEHSGPNLDLIFVHKCLKAVTLFRNILVIAFFFFCIFAVIVLFRMSSNTESVIYKCSSNNDDKWSPNYVLLWQGEQELVWNNNNDNYPI